MKNILIYKNKTSIIILTILLNFLTSYTSQEVKPVNLENVTKDFDVSGFYQKRIENTEKTLKLNPKKIKKEKALKLLDNTMFLKDTLDYYKSNGRFSNEIYIQSINDWMTRNYKPTEMFGFKYQTVVWNPQSKLGILNKVIFPKLDMTVGKNKKLMYLKASKTSSNTSDYEKIKEYFNKKYQNISLDGDKTNILCWQGKDFYYFLYKKDRKQEVVKNFDSKGEAIYKSIDVTDIELEFYTKSYILKMEKEKLYTPTNMGEHIIRKNL